MIEFKDVNFGFENRRGILRSLNFTIEDGSWVAIVGSNGSGKTTFARLAAGLIEPVSGKVLVDGLDPAEGDSSASVGIAFQNPDSQFVTPTVEREVLFGMENRTMEPERMKERLVMAARSFGLVDFLSRNPHELSGGEKQRVVLASLWAMDPKNLVLDEPFSFLDEGARADFLKSLRSFFSGRGRTVLWTTVREEETYFSSRVLFLHNGSIIYDGPPQGMVDAVRQDILRKALVRIVPDQVDAAIEEKKRREITVAGCEREGEELLKLRDAVFEKGEFRLSVKELSVGRGEFLGIHGPSGSGKTTLLMGCSGLLPPRSGSAIVLGRWIRSRRDAPVGRFAFLFQSPEEGFFGSTTREEVALARKSFHGRKGLEDAVAAAIEMVGLGREYLDRNPFSLSQGEKRLVAIASTLVVDAEILFLDEPTIFLDGAGVAAVCSLLERLHQTGKSAVIASHDKYFLAKACDRVVEL